MIEVPVQHGGILQIRERSGHALQDSSEELWRDIILSLFSRESYNSIKSVTSYRKKMTDTREYPQYFVKKIRGCHNR